MVSTHGRPARCAGLRNAKVTIRFKGELQARGTRLGCSNVNSVLPFPGPVTPERTEQTITLVPDDAEVRARSSTPPTLPTVRP